MSVQPSTVVFFDQKTGALHMGCWSKSSSPEILHLYLLQTETRQVYNLFQALWNGFIIKGVRVGVQSLFDAIAVQTVTLLAVHVKGAKNCADSYIFIDVIAVIFSCHIVPSC